MCRGWKRFFVSWIEKKKDNRNGLGFKVNYSLSQRTNEKENKKSGDLNDFRRSYSNTQKIESILHFRLADSVGVRSVTI